MSGYGPPQGPSGPQSFAPASSGPASSPATTEQRAQLMLYAAGGLGILSFIWGFLDWLSADSIDDVGVSGYASVGAAVVGLSAAAGLMALAGVFEKKKDVGLAPAAVAVAALLVILGQLFSHGDGVSVSIGLILALITVILQAAALILAWMMAAGRMPAPKPKQQQWPQQQPQGQYGPPPQQNPGQGYGPPPSSYGQSSQTSQLPSQPQGPPQGQPQGQPQGPPPGYQPRPPQSDFGRPQEYGQQDYGQPGPSSPQSQPGQPGQSGQHGQPGSGQAQ